MLPKIVEKSNYQTTGVFFPFSEQYISTFSWLDLMSIRGAGTPLMLVQRMVIRPVVGNDLCVWKEKKSVANKLSWTKCRVPPWAAPQWGTAD